MVEMFTKVRVRTEKAVGWFYNKNKYIEGTFYFLIITGLLLGVLISVLDIFV